MPELPEVETMRRGIAGIVGGRVEAVERVSCRLRPIHIAPSVAAVRRRLAGRRITDVGRAGKRVVIHLENDQALVIEPRMTGLVLIADPPNQAHLRLRLRIGGSRASQLLYWDRRGLGRITLYSRMEYEWMFGSARLGPDALGITAAVLRERLAGSRRAIKVALLDQRAVAGIGNLYASEILHTARLHPARTCDSLRARNWQALCKAIRHVLCKAIRYEGSTLGDGTYRNALNQPGSYQNYHRVYDRADELCPVCRRRRIVRIVQCQRSTFFCPGCQK